MDDNKPPAASGMPPTPRMPAGAPHAVRSRHDVDPRTIITPDAFTVAPELLGRPLAGPWRRAAAMLLDLCLIAILANAPGFLLAMAGAWVLWRATASATGGPLYKRWTKVWLRATAALVFFVALLSADWPWEGREPEMADVDAQVDDAIAVSGLAGLGTLFGTGGDFLTLRDATSPEDATAAAARMISTLEATGMSRADMEAMIAELSAEAEGDEAPLPPVAIAALAAALGQAPGADIATAVPQPSPDTAVTLTRAYADAIEAGDTATLAALRPRLAALVAADTIGDLTARVNALDERADELDDRADSLDTELATLREEGPGMVAMLGSLADDLGVGFGWSGLYFTAFLTLWGGATPGKRLLNIRVLRLDGRPIRWFAALERFGGYSAGIATGLLGFAQILWDRNRQGIHDKIAETVVVVD